MEQKKTVTELNKYLWGYLFHWCNDKVRAKVQEKLQIWKVMPDINELYLLTEPFLKEENKMLHCWALIRDIFNLHLTTKDPTFNPRIGEIFGSLDGCSSAYQILAILLGDFDLARMTRMLAGEGEDLYIDVSKEAQSGANIFLSFHRRLQANILASGPFRDGG